MKAARRRCYQCRRYICPECQVKSGGHIYCSKKCAKKSIKTEKWERRKNFFEKKGRQHIFRMVFYPALILSLALAYFFYDQWMASISEEPREVQIKAARKEREPEPPDWAAPGPIEITEPKEEEKVFESEIGIKGSAPHEAMVAVYLNGEKVDAVFSPDGSWEFQKVPLKTSENIIQARYFDNYGNNSYSKAVRVHLLSKPSLAFIPKREEPYFSPKLSTFLDLKQAKEGKKQVLLTFDGGSNDNSTENIIKVLKANNIRATIFLTGEFINRYPERVKRLVQDGHTIGNHTYSHPHLTTYSFNEKQATLPGVTKDLVVNQLNKANELFMSLTGKNLAPYWRAPFGEKNSQILKWAYSAGYRHIHWTPKLDTLDWVADTSSPLFREPKEILRRILSQSQKGDAYLDGGIVLMHLGSERPHELQAETIICDLIAQLESKGFSFITVDETAWAKEPPPVAEENEK